LWNGKKSKDVKGSSWINKELYFKCCSSNVHHIKKKMVLFRTLKGSKKWFFSGISAETPFWNQYF